MCPSPDQLSKNEYFLRMNRVIDYINNHYADDLTLEKLANVACFSKFHFHRLFRALVGETLNDFIQRIRLERSARKLTTDLEKSITEIALDCGFSSSQHFAKAFKVFYGITPSDFRARFNWENWSETIKSLREEDFQKFESNAEYLHSRYFIQQNLSLQQIINKEKELQVKIVEMSPFRVAYIRKIGSYTDERLLPAYKKLLQWADPKGLREAGMRIISVIWTHPFITPEDKLIFDTCITIPESIKTDKINIQILPGGKYAIYHCEIGPNGNAETWMSFILNWLIYSDYQMDTRPAYQIFYNDPVESCLKHEILDLCMPIKPLYE